MSRPQFRVDFWMALLAVAFVSVAAMATSHTVAAEPGGNAQQAIARVMQVQDRHTGRLMALPGVVGTATGLNAGGRPRCSYRSNQEAGRHVRK
jgi:hypothetical protein